MRSVPHRVVCLLGLDDGVFPRKSPRDGDDLMLERAARRRPRSAQRGPPAAARRAAGRDRPPRRHLHGQRRAHEHRRARRRCRSASCSTSSTAPFAPTAAPARERVVVRHPLQPFDPRNFDPGALVADRTVELRPGRRSPAPARWRPARAGRPPFLPEPLPARPTRRSSSSTTSCASSSTRSARSCASGSASASATSSDEIDDALPVELDGLRASGASASGCSRRASPAPTGAPRSWPRSPAARCRRGSSAQPGDRPGLPDRRGDRRRGRARSCRPTRARLRSTSRSRLPDGRALDRHRRGRLRRRAAARSRYSRVAPEHRLALVGAAARADRRASRTRRSPPRPSAGRGRVATVTVARIAPLAGDARATAAAGARAPAGARRPLRPRACASRCRSTARPRPPTRAAALGGDDAATAAGEAWESGWKFAERGRRARAPARARRRASASTSCSAEPPRADERGPGWDDDGDHALRPLRAAPVGRPARSEEVDDAVSTQLRAPAVRRLRPAADGRHRARGERRHRQDVHDRRARRALRRRGHAARASSCS